jgi:hypothetical protein
VRRGLQARLGVLGGEVFAGDGRNAEAVGDGVGEDWVRQGQRPRDAAVGGIERRIAQEVLARRADILGGRRVGRIVVGFQPPDAGENT